jgi:Tol biopolymer transport system component
MLKVRAIFLCLFLLISLMDISDAQQKDERKTYFGQKPPGLKAERFAPEIFSHEQFKLHGFPTFSPDGLEVYWPVLPPRILYTKYENGKWGKPSVAAFSERNLQAPIFSPDGTKMYFQLSRPGGFGALDIWYIEKKGSTWSQKKNLPSPPNSMEIESQPSFTEDGTMYYTGKYEKGHLNRGIYRSKFKNGKFQTPELLPISINSELLDYTPFISPDESFLLFGSTRPTKSESDIKLYVSFRNEDGTWKEPVNLNQIMGFNQAGRFPYVTPDGKYIIFQSNREYYWVSIQILEKAR